MFDYQFESIKRLLQKQKNASVHLNLSIDFFEKLFDFALANNCLEKVTFTGFFNPRQQAIITNLYIVAIYKKQHANQPQIEALAARYNLVLSNSFDFHANHTKHNVELHGYNKNNVRSLIAQTEISKFKIHYLANFVRAIEFNNTHAMLQAFYYKSIDPNVPISGKLPLEYACAKNHIHVTRCLLDICRADLFAKNSFGKDAIHQICLHSSSNVLFFLLDNEYLAPCAFNETSR